AVAPQAQQAGISLIAFSNNRQIAQPGVYLLGFLPEEQVQRVTAYAIDKDYVRFGILAPDNAYGETIAQALQQALQSYPSVKLAGAQAYKEELSGLELAVQQFAATRPEGGGYQAIFLPEGGQNLQTVAAALANAPLADQPVRWLGTGLWDDDS